MATKKELVAAQNFSRRRLLTAFVSGAPGGRELEPAKPLVGVVAGVVLSALVVAGSLVSGLFGTALPDGWEDSSLVVVKDSGARYVARAGVLYPVHNITSAHLLAADDAGSLLVVQADEADLAHLPRSSSIVGIEGAPDALPPAGSLIGAGWLSCAVDEERTWTDLSAERADTAPGGALVAAGGATHYVSGTHRHEVAEQDLNALSLFLGFDPSSARQVSGRWLNLFTEGTPLRPFTVPGAGSALSGPAAQIAADLQVGSVVRLRNAAGDTGAVHVFDSGGGLVPLNPVALELYYMGSGLGPEDVLTLDNSEVQQVEVRASSDLVPTDWPTEARPDVAADVLPCARLVENPEGSSAQLVAGPDGEVPDQQVTVDPGAGALVQLDGGGSQGSFGLIDERGRLYPIPVGSPDVLARLGYGEVTVPRVSSFWAALFPTGPTLTVGAAASGVPEPA